MKTLSLWQPWASLLAHGAKRVETRGWFLRHRGPLLIHAAKRWTEDLQDLCLEQPFRDTLRGLGYTLPPPGHNWTLGDLGCKKTAWGMGLGAIVGRVNVVECYPVEAVDFDHAGLDAAPLCPVDQYAPGKLRLWHEQRAFGDFSPGRYAILCGGFAPLPQPVLCRGAQGLFDAPADVLARVEAQLVTGALSAGG